MIVRCLRNRRRERTYRSGGGESNANLAGPPTGTTAVSPDGGPPFTQRRGIIPSTAFFSDRLDTTENRPQRSSSPTLGSNGEFKHDGRKIGAGLAAGGVAGAMGAAAIEEHRHGGMNRRTATSPIPEDPPPLGPPRTSDMSVTSFYRDDWPGPGAAGVDPLFHDQYPPHDPNAPPLPIHDVYSGRESRLSSRPDSHVSLWPGPGAYPLAPPHGIAQSNLQPMSVTEEEPPETLRPSPARTPQIHSAEIDSYPFPERQASPHTGFNATALPLRKPVAGPPYSGHGMT
jgi:hypothetical protein